MKTLLAVLKYLGCFITAFLVFLIGLCLIGFITVSFVNFLTDFLVSSFGLEKIKTFLTPVKDPSYGYQSLTEDVLKPFFLLFALIFLAKRLIFGLRKRFAKTAETHSCLPAILITGSKEGLYWTAVWGCLYLAFSIICVCLLFLLLTKSPSAPQTACAAGLFSAFCSAGWRGLRCGR